MSIWLESCNLKKYNKLENDISCDICIIGGGITGISTAYYLSKMGFSISILEKDNLATKTTGNTTGKITSQHGLIYDYLLKTFGLDFSKDYLEANELAIKNIKQIIDENKIECDFEYKNNFVFTESLDYVQKFKDEYKALKEIGFSPIFNEKLNIPYNVISSLGFPNQAQFNSIKYINGLLCALEKSNVQIYENSKVIDVKQEDNLCTISTEIANVNCKYAIITTRYPFMNFPGFHFLKMYQSTSYAIAIDTDQNLFDDMYISFEEPTISLRTAIYNNKRIPIIAGFTHKTGEKKDSSDPYLFLEQIAQKMFPDYNIISKWCSQDAISVDKLPYIGAFSSFMPHVYFATGFKKWGMTTSNVASQIICDYICNIDNKYSSLFDSKRFHPIKNRTELKNMLVEISDSLVLKKFKIKESDIEKIKCNTARVIKIDGKLVGIYKNDKNEIFAVKPICSHLGCTLNWNNTLKTWDCPCHGSRFDYEGKCIYGPSVGDLERY